MLPPRSLGEPLLQWLFGALRDAILTGRLPAGLRLPASRVLAQQHGVSRGTVIAAYEQLAAEGYVQGHVGRGTFVARLLPDRWFKARAGKIAADVAAPTPPALRRSPFALHESGADARPFRAHLPELRLFPTAVWSRLAAQCARRIGVGDLGNMNACGLPLLREAIVSHLALARGVNVEPAQVLVVSSAQQALALCLRLLAAPGDAVWLEDPGYPGTRALLHEFGLCAVDVPVDRHGLQVDAAIALAPQARLACVTPSRQAPLGVPLSAPRRLALLDWAGAAGAWVVEDDYDSEYRWRGRPIAALKSQDRADRVVLVGTFSKLLFPALRLAYAVLPQALVQRFAHLHALLSRGLPALEQQVAARFILDGHFDRHLRRMRQLYAARSQVLTEALRRHAGDGVVVPTIDGGLDVAVHLRRAPSDRAVERRLASAGIESLALSRYRASQSLRAGLVLGFAAFDELQIETAVRGLARCLD